MTAASPVASSTPIQEQIRGLVAEQLERERLPHERQFELKQQRLRDLIRHTAASSPYYREALGPDAEHADLADLPTLSKPLLMEEFDRIATDRRIRRDGVEAVLAAEDPASSLFDDYLVFATSGTTGVPGVFVYSRDELARWTALCVAAFAQFGIGPESRLAAVGAPSELHITRRLFAGFMAGRTGVPQLSVTTPVSEMVAGLNAYQPEAIATYASIAADLADEQLQGRLRIAPRVLVVSSEVLTDETARLIEDAWGIVPVNVYASTEAPFMAIRWPGEPALRFSDGVILEAVDEAGRPVPAGQPANRVLLTNLVNRVQPLIRYELSDSVVMLDGPGPEPRIARIDGRSDDILTFAGIDGGETRVHPYRLRAPFTRLTDVRQYQIVQRPDVLQIRIVPRASAPVDLPLRVARALEHELAAAGAVSPRIEVHPVVEIPREPGHAAKVKLVARG
jgi:phenylacetate-coenzyme A ligase PaaK-like adenylate-forming protein